MPQPNPDALMSYTRFDDQYNNAHLTAFRERLSGAVQAHTGKPFHIFQDIEDIKWGQRSAQRIDEALATATFFIPILTPSFFTSEQCRSQLETFLERERQQGRSDLMLPVYYVRVPALDDPALREHDPLARTIAARKCIDWRDLRFEALDAPPVRKLLDDMARHIAQTLEHTDVPPPAPPSVPATPRQAAADTLRDTAERIVVYGDYISGDKVGSDKVGGDKIDAREAQGVVNRPSGEAAGTRGGEAAGTRGGEAAGTRGGEAAGTRGGEAAGTRGGEAAGTRGGEGLPYGSLFKVKAALKRAQAQLGPIHNNALVQIEAALQRVPRSHAQQAEALAASIAAMADAATGGSPDLDSLGQQAEHLEQIATELSTVCPEIAQRARDFVMAVAGLLD